MGSCFHSNDIKKLNVIPLSAAYFAGKEVIGFAELLSVFLSNVTFGKGMGTWHFNFDVVYICCSFLEIFLCLDSSLFVVNSHIKLCN